MQNFWSPKGIFQFLFPTWVSLVLHRRCHGDAEVHSSPKFISGLSQHTASALSSSLIIYCILLADLIVFCPVLESCMDGFRKKSMFPDQQAFFPQHRGMSKVPPFLLFICFLYVISMMGLIVMFQCIKSCLPCSELWKQLSRKRAGDV